MYTHLSFPLPFISVLSSDTILRSAIQKHDLTSLKILFSGAAPLGAELVSTVMKRMKGIGADVSIPQGVFPYLRFTSWERWVSNLCIGYGLTETSPTVFLLPVTDASSRIGAAGVLLPNLEVKLVGEAEGEVRISFPALIWVRPMSMMNSTGTHRYTRRW
jgi:acyl-CoA synthetase (AMP-forming)/AMP-acid ligase II